MGPPSFVYFVCFVPPLAPWRSAENFGRVDWLWVPSFGVRDGEPRAGPTRRGLIIVRLRGFGRFGPERLRLGCGWRSDLPRSAMCCLIRLPARGIERVRIGRGLGVQVHRVGQVANRPAILHQDILALFVPKILARPGGNTPFFWMLFCR